jgi:ankyrin repeat protein
VVRQLLAKGGLDPDSKNKYGRTPLSWAATNGREAAVKLLLATDGVDPNSKDNDGRTPLSWAAEGGHEVTVAQLLAKGGVDPDSKDNSGRTPLSWAAVYGQETVVKLLLASGRVDPDSKSKHGQTPLSLATANGYKAVIKPLFTAAKATDINSKNISSEVALQSTTKNGEEAEMLAGYIPPVIDFADRWVKSSIRRDWKITVTRNDMRQKLAWTERRIALSVLCFDRNPALKRATSSTQGCFHNN